MLSQSAKQESADVAKAQACVCGGKTKVEESNSHLFLYNRQCGKNQSVVVYLEAIFDPYNSGVSCVKPNSL